MSSPPAHSEQTLIGAERQQLEAFLDDNRSELAGALTGLTEEQARRRLVPSLTTLLGLLKHAAWVERVWFQASLLGHSRDELGIPQHVDDSFRLTDGDSIAAVTADFHAACAERRTDDGRCRTGLRV